MGLFLRLLATLLYLLWLPAMLLGRWLGRDPLQLKKPQTNSYWIVREPKTPAQSYYSEDSVHEGRPAPREGASGALVGTSPPLLAKVLRAIAKTFA